MKKLKLPIIKSALPGGRALSMEAYLKFVMLNFRCGHDRGQDRKSRRAQDVHVQFVLGANKKTDKGI